MRPVRRLMLVVPLIALVALLDFVTKAAALGLPPEGVRLLPVLDLSLGFNRGISFGIFHDALAAPMPGSGRAVGAATGGFAGNEGIILDAAATATATQALLPVALVATGSTTRDTIPPPLVTDTATVLRVTAMGKAMALPVSWSEGGFGHPTGPDEHWSKFATDREHHVGSAR